MKSKLCLFYFDDQLFSNSPKELEIIPEVGNGVNQTSRPK